jgi:hypothetical protein
MSTDVSEVRAAMIALMMEAVRTSEASVDIQLRTRQYIPEDSELHSRCRENLKSHNLKVITVFTRLCQSYFNLIRIKSVYTVFFKTDYDIIFTSTPRPSNRFYFHVFHWNFVCLCSSLAVTSGRAV